MSGVTIEVILALVPLVLFLLAFQAMYLRLPRQYVHNLFVGVALAFVGLVLFFQGVHTGFIPAGRAIGGHFGGLERTWVLIPLGGMMGFCATYAEPAVRVFSYQVEQSSNGAIRARIILITISVSVALTVSLGMVRLVYGVPFRHIILPLYLLGMVMLFFSDKTFTSLAFDAGGVATGPMAVTFLMSMAVGAAARLPGRDPVQDGFGLIALIAAAPIIAIMALGVAYSKKGGI